MLEPHARGEDYGEPMSEDATTLWERPIFIGSMSRSGSTLLQRVLNTHPGLAIWGEHGGLLTGITKSLELAQSKDVIRNLETGFASRDLVAHDSDQRSFAPWVSPFRSEDWVTAIRSTLLNLYTAELSSEVRWGFKEIRYGYDEHSMLMSLFPGAHLIVLARDVEGFVLSRYFAFGNKDFNLETDVGRTEASRRCRQLATGWAKRYDELLRVMSETPGRTSVVMYSDLTAGSQRPAQLFEELGEVAPDAARLDAVFDVQLGSSYKSNERAVDARGALLEVLRAADIDWAQVKAVSLKLGL